MIDTKELKGIMGKEEVSGAELARRMRITPKTFYAKMKKGVFGSDEMDIMIEVLHIHDPAAIFFSQKVTSEDTE